MCNWLILFRHKLTLQEHWISVFCETKEEAINLSEEIETATDLAYQYKIICIGTGQQ